MELLFTALPNLNPPVIIPGNPEGHPNIEADPEERDDLYALRADVVANLTALTTLHVDALDPLQLPPSAVAARGLDAIRAYFKDLEAGTAIARTCMLVLLGDAEMGKTSLLNGLLNDCTPNPAPAGPDGRTIHVASGIPSRSFWEAGCGQLER